MRGVIHYELLVENQIITAKLYCQQLQRLSTATARNCPVLFNCKGIIFQHNNTRSNTAGISPPMFASSNFNLSCNLDNYLREKNLRSRDEVENGLNFFFNL